MSLFNEIDAHAQTLTAWHFEATDSQGRKWECIADLQYTDAGKGHPPYKIEDLRDLKARLDNGVEIEIHPDDAIMKALADDIEESDDIWQAEEAARCMGGKTDDEHAP